MQKKNILFIIPFLPYPLESGGHQALYNGILAVKEDFNVSIAYEAEDNEKYRNAEKEFQQRMPNVRLLPLLNKPWIPPSYKTRLSNGLKRFVDTLLGTKPAPVIIDKNESKINWWKHTIIPSSQRWIEHIANICHQNHFDIIQVEMPWRISDIFVLPEDAKKIYVHHELGFVRRELEIGQITENIEYANTIRKFADNNEISQLNLYDSIISLSPIDAQKMKGKGVAKPIYTSFAIIDTPSLENIEIGNGKRLTFIGPDSHAPNLVGITWFLENCWNILKLLDPEITFDIIGNWKEDHKQEFSSIYPGVNFLGFVDDLNAAIQGSTMIVPITIGSGIRMKILEAASKGVPFVSTTVGAEGIPVTNGKDCFLSDTPESFVNDILKLQEPNLRKMFISNAHNMVNNNYSKEALRMNRMEIYQKITN